jgi:S-formylglutathione hydrolase FrmB
MRIARPAVLIGSLAVGAAVLVPTGSASAATNPTFTSGNGITVVNQTSNGREIDLTVTTTAVSGQHQVIVLLPESYSNDTTTRYPVLYLFHGALAGPNAWTTNGGAANSITDPYPLITVMPDAGLKGWNVNWQSCAQICPQNWETFHLSQVVPWIDANLRTIANRTGRAVAGLSMGGFGSIHYAEDRADLFTYAAGFSGALDTGDYTTESAIYGEETGAVPGSGTPVPPGSIMGPEYAPFNQTALNISDTKASNIAKLVNTTVGLYVGTGNGSSGDGIVESAVKPQNDRMAAGMAAAGVHYWYSQDHVNSADLGWGCDNNHDQMCWNAYLADDLPRMMAVLSHPTLPPPPPPPPGNVVADPGFESAGMGPWVCTGQCGVDQNLGNAHSGVNNGWVRNTSGWNDIHQTVPVAANTNYTLTGWIRTSANNNAGYFGVRTTGGTVISEQEYNALAGYTQLTVHLNSGNNTSVQVYGGLWPPNNQDTWAQFDDFSLSSG